MQSKDNAAHTLQGEDMTQYMVISYTKEYVDDETTPTHKFIFPHLSKREVVGILKTIMDNLSPHHVDVMNEEDAW